MLKHADYKLTPYQKIKLIFSLVQIESICRQQKNVGWIEDVAGKKRENNGYQHFFLFQQCFQKAFQGL